MINLEDLMKQVKGGWRRRGTGTITPNNGFCFQRAFWKREETRTVNFIFKCRFDAR